MIFLTKIFYREQRGAEMVGGEPRRYQRDGTSSTGPSDNAGVSSVDHDVRSRDRSRITRSQTTMLQ